jgi:hypothetical protein
MGIPLKQFAGLVPRVAPALLPDSASQVAVNCQFGSGTLRPLPGELSVVAADNAVLKSGTKKSIFKYNNTWLNWVDDVNVCRSALAMDSFDRIYWTGDGAPKMADNATALSGTAKPGGSWNLGLPKPAAAATVSKSGAAGDPTEDTTRSYVYTYVSAYGEEGPPSSPSALITVSVGNTVTVSDMSVAPSGAYNIVSKNIYRVNTGSSASEYQFVGSVLVAVTTYSDTVDDADLGEVLPSSGWIAPNATMVDLVAHPAGFFVGHYKNVLCPSEAYMPHAWPAAYQMTVDAEIVAKGCYGNSILVVTKGMPYIVTGDNPAQLGKPEKLEKGEACILKRGFVDMGYACVYPGPSGLWIVGTGAINLMTEKLMTQKEWQTLSSGLVFAVQYETNYIAFTASGGFVFDTATGNLTNHTVTATGGWYDRENGNLYLVMNGAIVQWIGGSAVNQLTWKSKRFRAPYPINHIAARVIAAGPVTVLIYADGVLRHTETQTVRDSEPFMITDGDNATDWEIEVRGFYEVTSILVGRTVAELGRM